MNLTAPHWRPVEFAADEPLDALDEVTLVGRARTDADAFAELYRRYLPRIYAFALRRCRARPLAEDVTSATFERALRGLSRFDAGRGGGFGPWLFRIAANELADHYRAGQRASGRRGQQAMGAFHPVDQSDAGFERVERAGEDEALLDALGRLPPRYQEVVSLRYLAGLDPAETAAAMEMTKPQVALLLHRALGALGKALRQSGREG